MFPMIVPAISNFSLVALMREAIQSHPEALRDNQAALRGNQEAFRGTYEDIRGHQRSSAHRSRSLRSRSLRISCEPFLESTAMSLVGSWGVGCNQWQLVAISGTQVARWILGRWMQSVAISRN